MEETAGRLYYQRTSIFKTKKAMTFTNGRNPCQSARRKVWSTMVCWSPTFKQETNFRLVRKRKYYYYLKVRVSQKPRGFRHYSSLPLLGAIRNWMDDQPRFMEKSVFYKLSPSLSFLALLLPLYFREASNKWPIEAHWESWKLCNALKAKMENYRNL